MDYTVTSIFWGSVLTLSTPWRKERGHWGIVTGGHMLSCTGLEGWVFPTTHTTSCKARVHARHHYCPISDVLVKKILASYHLFPVTTNVLVPS